MPQPFTFNCDRCRLSEHGFLCSGSHRYSACSASLYNLKSLPSEMRWRVILFRLLHPEEIFSARRFSQSWQVRKPGWKWAAPLLLVSLLALLMTGLAGFSWGPDPVFTKSAGSSGFTVVHGGIFFPETGHTVKGKFLIYFLSAEQPLEVFGYPVSAEMADPLRPGRKVQNFQRARMVADPETGPAAQVQLAPLGTYAYDPKSGQNANIDISSSACRYFVKTQHYVCFAFLQFYDANNGPEFFGDPISEVIIEDGVSVQYFERARLEWRANNPVGQRTVLTNLGTLAYQTQNGQDAPEPALIKGDLTELHVEVFAANPLISADEMQTLYVIVEDQLCSPIPNATVVIKVRMADGSTAAYRPAETNAYGLSVQRLVTVTGYKPNQMVAVSVEVQAQDGKHGSAISGFRVWW